MAYLVAGPSFNAEVFAQAIPAFLSLILTKRRAEPMQIEGAEQGDPEIGPVVFIVGKGAFRLQADHKVMWAASLLNDGRHPLFDGAAAQRERL